MLSLCPALCQLQQEASPAALGLAPGQDVQTLGKGLEQPCRDCTPALLEPEDAVLGAQQSSCTCRVTLALPLNLGSLGTFSLCVV